MTRSKAPLAMIELLVMLLILAFCSAMCLRGLIWSSNQSEALSQRQEALSIAASLSDAIRSEDTAAFDALGIPEALNHDIYNYKIPDTGLFLSIVHGRPDLHLLRTDIKMTDKNGADIYTVSVNSQY